MIGVAFLAAGLLGTYAPPPPAANLAPQPNFNQTCADTGNASHACFVATMSALDFARHQEGLGPLYLPRNWLQLTPPEQLLVITNLERTARKEQPITGLTAGLNVVAAAGAVHQTDPKMIPITAPVVSIWARTEGPLASDYGWMYNDGWSGPLQRTPNLTCTSATASGCWGHRANILAEWHHHLLSGRSGPWYLAAGAAQRVVPISTPGPSLVPPTALSDAMIVTAYLHSPTYRYTWQEALAEGAGNPKTGWNPVASGGLTFLWEFWAWVRGHVIDTAVAAAVAVATIYLKIRRRRLRRRQHHADARLGSVTIKRRNNVSDITRYKA